MPVLKLSTVVGARPQFVKAGAASRVFRGRRLAGECSIEERIIHTGQHYDHNMSGSFFEELEIPKPSVNLEVGSGAHGKQTGEMLARLEEELIRERPDVVMVYGDTNSTLAGALAAVKLHIPVAHVEAGLRSFNRRMPEEVNRVVTDQLSELLLCPTPASVQNLKNEGVTAGVHEVGDVMLDAFVFSSGLAEQSSQILRRLGVSADQFCLLTVHRAENTDDPKGLAQIMAAMREVGRVSGPIIFPAHPRSRSRVIQELGGENVDGVRVIDPVPYLDMLALERGARAIFTDSGGVQKEARWSGVPCVTLRDETEWVETVQSGDNQLVGVEPERIKEAARWALGRGRRNALADCDATASSQIADILLRTFS